MNLMFLMWLYNIVWRVVLFVDKKWYDIYVFLVNKVGWSKDNECD